MTKLQAVPLRPYVIALANQKGGVGKTTSTINLAVALQEAGHRCVVIDLDPQGNATSGLGVDNREVPYTAYEVLHPDHEKRVSLDDALVTSPYGPLVLAGHDSMALVERDGNGFGGEQSLAVALAAAQPAVFLVDCPPNLGRLTVMALVAAGRKQTGDSASGEESGGEVMAPCSPGPDELQGLSRLLRTISGLKANGLALALDLGTVLVTDFDGRNRLSKETRQKLKDAFADQYLGEVSSTVRVGEAKARRMPLCEYAPESTAAQDYRDMARRFATRRGWIG